MVEYLNQNILFMDNVDIIAHQVNCQGVMGAGLAKQIKTKYPIVYQEYLQLYKRQRPVELLGQCLAVPVNNSDIFVANLFGQLSYGKGTRQTDYEALEKSLKQLKEFMVTSNLHSLALPHNLGCGLAGGDWNIVRKMIEKIFNDNSITCYICKL